MTHWADEPDIEHHRIITGRAPWWIALAFSATIALMPVAVFADQLGAAGMRASEAWRNVFAIFTRDGAATLITALIAAAASVCIALTVIGRTRHGNESRSHRRQYGIPLILVASLVTAVLPPQITGTALVRIWLLILPTWEQAAMCLGLAATPSLVWNPYDHSPLVWASAMVARFAFIPVGLVWLLNRRIPRTLTDSAALDGADDICSLLSARLPLLWRPMIAAAALVACLTVSEISASVFVQPSQFIGGSVAVLLDQQMHYNRNDITTALSLAILVPAVLAAVIVPTLLAICRRIGSPRRTFL